MNWLGGLQLGPEDGRYHFTQGPSAHHPPGRSLRCVQRSFLQVHRNLRHRRQAKYFDPAGTFLPLQTVNDGDHRRGFGHFGPFFFFLIQINTVKNKIESTFPARLSWRKPQEEKSDLEVRFDLTPNFFSRSNSIPFLLRKPLFSLHHSTRKNLFHFSSKPDRKINHRKWKSPINYNFLKIS
uniref:(northern house mosquito) hypothetical protein n=1 Tax=Culex pipiens TaxID=7175 RepID=A0A8D8BKC2_CULPI